MNIPVTYRVLQKIALITRKLKIDTIKCCKLQKYSTQTKPGELHDSVCSIGTIGHVDHGKTTLTAAITKCLSEENGSCNYMRYEDIDKAPEEKARGITINVAHLGYATKKRRYAHTDCPGHMDFVKNMISGASQMDGAILVVAADDGPMPQTREHLLLAKQVGIKHIVVYINKADVSDKETMELIELETLDLLATFGFDGEKTPFICGSAKLALSGDQSEYGIPSIKKLLDKIDEHIPMIERQIDVPFVVPIDNMMTVPGRGTVLIGTIKQGEIKKNAEANLLGFDRLIKTSVADIQIFRKSVPSALAGENVGLLVRNVKLNAIKRGMVLCRANYLKLGNHFEAQIYLLTSAEGGRDKPIQKNGFCAQLFCTTWNTYTRLDILLSEKDVMLMPGENATARLTTMYEMPLIEGEVFTIRELNKKTVATGIITKIHKSLTFDKKKMNQVSIKL